MYLVEAKYEASPTGVGDLHAFHGKVTDKAGWTRGLFVAFEGFTQIGLEAFGRGKRIILMTGEDLHDALGRHIPLSEVLERKVRAAAETGWPFTPLADLFRS
ncbi:restriction endonuclease [Roseomonas sp. SXEYE001]|uniref:restriction endonuclease n=1 Tax=Roseomonas xinghualingensis TaxID=2986475 RepID=UPI0021F1CD75|nr:restriction endonuclease [Roseomonas sp. SXEYE001]MCV4210391.1 restriction endonuclease [Roseomonas sp. SXEYE001]